MSLKLKTLSFFLCALPFLVSAQVPMAKIDIDMEGRPETEVNQEGYKSWYIARVATAGITISGITFSLTTKQPTPATMRTSWSKALIQSPYFTRLVNDGVKVDNDSMLKYPNTPAVLELRISGLPVGTHTLQTYHNIWEDTTKITHAPMNVYLNGNLIFSRVKRTVQVKKNTDATILLTEMTVTDANKEMVLLFEADKNFTPTTGKTADLNVCINAIELNTDDATKQSREPYPATSDMHVNADTGFVDLRWKPALNNFAKTHTVYVGTDSIAISKATIADATLCKGTFPLNQTSFRVSNPYNLNTYYWRVDETDSAGVTTKGRIWNFCPRHMAFRDAEGYGRFALGGRKGKVVYVTNLNDAGPGSFREAVSSGIGPRTIIFNVSGIITLDSKIFSDRNITIAGQTAPGKGICLRKSSFALSSEAICRFIRMRLGTGTSTDGMGMPGAAESIMDHCSISWSIDEACTSRNAKNITIQKTLISEALNIAGLDNYDEGHAHGYAAVIGGDISSFHHNLIAHCYGRNPRLDGGLDGNNYYAGRVDIFNNVVYNWMLSSAYGEAHEGQFVNNYYKQGPATDIGRTTMFVADVNQRETNLGTESYYTGGNTLELKTKNLQCDGSVFDCGITPRPHGTMVIDWDILVKKPFFPSYAKIETAYDAYKSVLSDVGCNMPIFDDHDKRIVDETLSGTAKYSGSLTKRGGIIDTETDAGGYEDYPIETRSADFDTDLDGLPNWWETLYGTNPNSASGDFSDTNADPDKNGYTALEEYLEWMAVPHYYIQPTETGAINLSDFAKGYVNPTYTYTSAPDLNLKLNGATLLVSPNSTQKGISYLDVKATDAQGSNFTKRIGICVGSSYVLDVPSIKSESNCKVYPSQFDKQFNIDLKTTSCAMVNVTLTDLLGKKVVQNSYSVQPGNNNLTFNCPASLQPAMYLIRVTDANNKTSYLTTLVVKK